MRIAIALAVLLFSAGPVAAQGFERGWLDVNLGVAVAAEDGYSVTKSGQLYSETATFTADYFWPRGANVDFGGGVMFNRVLGVGLSISGTAHKDTAVVSARIPHPFRFNVFGSDSAETEELMKTEGAVHLQAMIVAAQSPRARLRVFGGPTYFRVRQDTFDDIRYAQVAPPLGGNSVTIIGAPFSEAEATGWGFHAGADVSYFFTRVVGVGGIVRFSRGSVDLIDLGGDAVEVKTGGVQAGGGLRLKF